MISTFETKLTFNKQEQKLIDLDLKHFNIAKRKCLTLYTKHLNNNSKSNNNKPKLSSYDLTNIIYHELKELYPLTSHQIKSIQSIIEAQISSYYELNKVNIINTSNKLQALKAELKQLKSSLIKEKAKLKNDKLSCFIKKNKVYRNINTINNTIIQKQKRINKLSKKLKDLVNYKNLSIIYGGKQLVKQRNLLDLYLQDLDKYKNKLLTRKQFNNLLKTKYNNLKYRTREQYKRDYGLALNNELNSMGSKDKPFGNAEIQLDFNPKTNNYNLRLRHIDKTCNILMEEYKNTNKTDINNLIHKHSSKRMNIRFNEHIIKEFKSLNKFLTNNNITFKDIIDNKIPITYKIKKKHDSYGNLGYYLIMSFDTNKVLDKSFNTTALNDNYILGLDLNNDGIAYTLVDNKGNRVKVNNKIINGYITWCLNNNNNNLILKNYNTKTRKLIISNTISVLMKEVNKLIKEDDKLRNINYDIAIENLDFSKNNSELTKSKSNKLYNNMISSFGYKTFKDLIISKCFKQDKLVYLVNPMLSSKIGYIKYGFNCKGMKYLFSDKVIDISASHYIARQVILNDSSTIYVKRTNKINEVNCKLIKEKSNIKCKVNKSFNKDIGSQNHLGRITSNSNETTCERIESHLGKTLEYSNVSKSLPKNDEYIKAKDLLKVLGNNRSLWNSRLKSYINKLSILHNSKITSLPKLSGYRKI